MKVFGPTLAIIGCLVCRTHGQAQTSGGTGTAGDATTVMWEPGGLGLSPPDLTATGGTGGSIAVPDGGTGQQNTAMDNTALGGAPPPSGPSSPQSGQGSLTNQNPPYESLSNLLGFPSPSGGATAAPPLGADFLLAMDSNLGPTSGGGGTPGIAELLGGISFEQIVNNISGQASGGTGAQTSGGFDMLGGGITAADFGNMLTNTNNNGTPVYQPPTGGGSALDNTIAGGPGGATGGAGTGMPSWNGIPPIAPSPLPTGGAGTGPGDAGPWPGAGTGPGGAGTGPGGAGPWPGAGAGAGAGGAGAGAGGAGAGAGGAGAGAGGAGAGGAVPGTTGTGSPIFPPMPMPGMSSGFPSNILNSFPSAGSQGAMGNMGMGGRTPSNQFGQPAARRQATGGGFFDQILKNPQMLSSLALGYDHWSGGDLSEMVGGPMNMAVGMLMLPRLLQSQNRQNSRQSSANTYNPYRVLRNPAPSNPLTNMFGGGGGGGGNALAALTAGLPSMTNSVPGSAAGAETNPMSALNSLLNPTNARGLPGPTSGGNSMAPTDPTALQQNVLSGGMPGSAPQSQPSGMTTDLMNMFGGFQAGGATVPGTGSAAMGGAATGPTGGGMQSALKDIMNVIQSSGGLGSPSPAGAGGPASFDPATLMNAITMGGVGGTGGTPPLASFLSGQMMPALG